MGASEDKNGSILLNQDLTTPSDQHQTSAMKPRTERETFPEVSTDDACFIAPSRNQQVHKNDDPHGAESDHLAHHRRNQSGDRSPRKMSTMTSRNQKIEETEKKHVSFNPVVRTRTIRMKHYKLRALESWYSEIDLERVTRECLVTVAMMVSEKQIREEDGFCERGLEHKTPSGSKLRRRNKHRSITSVLQKQFELQCQGVSDPAEISAAYCSCTEQSKRMSQIRALQDEEEVSMIFRSSSVYRRDDEVVVCKRLRSHE